VKEFLPTLIATAFPTLMVLVAILLNQKGLERLEARMDRFDK
jgi:hypothetical protein